MDEPFMNRDQWAQIYDIARYNGVSPNQLIVELNAANPTITEPELYQAAISWSRERTIYPRVRLTEQGE